MHDVDAKLKELGLELPTPAKAVASYAPWQLQNDMLYISGQIPVLNGEKKYIGKVGADINDATAQEAARACALNILAHVKSAVNNDWSRIIACVRLCVFVNSTADYTNHPAIANGASELMQSVLGERGVHTRAAVGVSSLPLGVPVEVDAIFRIKL